MSEFMGKETDAQQQAAAQSKMKHCTPKDLVSIVTSGSGRWNELELSEEDAKKGYEQGISTQFSIRNKHVGRSLAFNHDKNPIHSEAEAAKMLLLSFASKGLFERDEVRSGNMSVVMGAVAERIMSQRAFVVAPGIWLSSLFARYFTFPQSTFPSSVPEFDVEPSLDLGCTVTYSKSRYSYPLLVPVEGSKQIDLEFRIAGALPSEQFASLGMMRIGFDIYTEGLFGKRVLVQSTELHAFPRTADPREIMKAYAVKGLSDMLVVYSRGNQASINGRESIHTTSHATYVSPEDYSNFGVSIGREDLGDKCGIVSPLALQAKIPRVLFRGIAGIMRNPEYTKKSSDFYSSSEERIKQEAERSEAVQQYLAMIPDCQTKLAEALMMQQRVYLSQETFFDPRNPVMLDDKFTLSVSLMRYEPSRGGIHVFISEAKTEKGWVGLTGGKTIMIGKTTIGAAPLLTPQLVEYLQGYRLDLNLERF